MRISLRLLCLTSLLTLPGQAFAGAWTQDKGNTQIILTGSYYGANKLWDNSGHKQSQPSYGKYELNPYLEYGLQDGLTAGASLTLQRTHQDKAAPGVFSASAGQSNWGMGDSEFFLRKRVFQNGTYVLSVEPMVKVPSPESAADQPRIGSSHYDAGVGVSGGYTFEAYGHQHYADIDTQFRHRFGAPHDQVHLAGTLGINVAPQWTIMPQTFVTLRTDSNPSNAFTQSPDDDYNLTRLQLSALYKMSEDLSLQFGGFTDIDGKNAGTGNGLLVALWKKL